MAETAEKSNFDEFKGKNCVFVAELVENQTPTQAVFRI